MSTALIMPLSVILMTPHSTSALPGVKKILRTLAIMTITMIERSPFTMKEKGTLEIMMRNIRKPVTRKKLHRLFIRNIEIIHMRAPKSFTRGSSA